MFHFALPLNLFSSFYFVVLFIVCMVSIVGYTLAIVLDNISLTAAIIASELKIEFMKLSYEMIY